MANKLNGTGTVIKFPSRDEQQMPVNWEKREARNNYSFTVCKVTNMIVDPATKLPLQFRPFKCLDGTNYLHEVISRGEELSSLFEDYPEWLHNFAFDTGGDSAIGFITQPKIDGVRCIVFGGVAYTASLRKIPNVNIQKVVSGGHFDGMDGELVAHSGNFREALSTVMSHNGNISNLRFLVFDFILFNTRTSDRLVIAHKKIRDLPQETWETLETELVASTFALASFCARGITSLLIDTLHMAAEDGLEGFVIRTVNSDYMFGRANETYPHLVKFKVVNDTEAVVLEVLQGRKNNNAPQDELDGTTSRLHQQDNFELVDTAGALLVVGKKGSPFAGKEFKVSLGSLSHAERELIWSNRAEFQGRTVTFKYFGFGDYELPRSPLFKGFREY